MKILLDTNVLVAAVTRDTDRSEDAIELLNGVDEYEFDQPHRFLRPTWERLRPRLVVSPFKYENRI